VLSFNVDSGLASVPRIALAIERIGADIVAVQEAKGATAELQAALAKHYRYVEERPYSLIASRFPIVEATEHEKIAIGDWPRSPRFQRHVLQLPSGRLAFYNVHPISPRGALNIHRFRHAFHAFRTGQAVNQESVSALEYNVELRRLQIEGVSRLARAERGPVILAGDFNLPALSQVFQSNLGGFQDGFRVAGAGFGYTFPARFPWMRLDRVLTSYDLRIVDFDVGCAGLSDHHCVIAEIRLP
jgi:vancomycin resistance protein VanJ